MVLGEVLVVLEIERCKRYLVGQAARCDPHVVDGRGRPRLAAAADKMPQT